MKYFLIFFFLLKMSQLQASSQDCFKQSGLTALTSNNFNPRAGVNLQMLTMQSSDTSKADCIYNYLNKELPYAIDDYIQASGCGKASTKDLADCKQVRDYANHVLNTFWDNSNSIFPKLTDEENIERAEAKNKDFDQWHPIDQVASKMRERRETLDQGLEAYQNKFSNISEIFRTCQEGSNDHIQKTITPFLTACAPSSILQQEDTLNDLSETSQKIAQQLDKENFDQYNQAILQGVSEISIRQTLQAIWAEKAHAYGSHYFDGDCTNLKAHQSQGHQALAGKDLSATCAKKKRERARAAICGGDTGSWRWDGTKYVQSKSRDALRMTRVNFESRQISCDNKIKDANGELITIGEMIDQEFSDFEKHLSKSPQPTRRIQTSEYQQEMAEYNQIINDFNQQCQQIREKVQAKASRELEQRLKQSEDRYARAAAVNKKDRDTNDIDYIVAAFGADNIEQVKERHSSLIMSKVGGRLLRVDRFARSVGFSGYEDTLKKCVNNNRPPLKPLSNIEQIMSAEDELLKLQLDGLANSIKTNHDAVNLSGKKLDNRMEEFLRYHPVPMMSFLKKNPSEKYAKNLCTHMQAIASSDRMWEVIDMTLAPVGAAASIALIVGSGGALAPAVFAAATALTTADVARSGFKIWDANQKQQQVQLGLAQMAIEEEEVLSKLEELIDLEGTISDETLSLALNIAGGAFGITDTQKMMRFAKDARKYGWNQAAQMRKTGRQVAGDDLVITSRNAGEPSVLRQRMYGSDEVNQYFDNFAPGSSQRKVWDDFLSDFKTQYPNASAGELDELKNMMYNVHKNCNAGAGVSVCKKKLLGNLRQQLREQYPKLDEKAINRMAASDVKILGESVLKKADDIGDMRDNVLFVRKSDDVTKNTEAMSSYYTELLEQRRLAKEGTEQGSFTANKSLKKIDEELEWFESDGGYLDRMISEGRVQSAVKQRGQEFKNAQLADSKAAQQVAQQQLQKTQEIFSQKIEDVSSQVRKVDDIPKISNESHLLGSLEGNSKRIEELQKLKDEISDLSKQSGVQPKQYGHGLEGKSHQVLDNIESEIKVLQNQNDFIKRRVIGEYEEIIENSANHSLSGYKRQIADNPSTKDFILRSLEEQIAEVKRIQKRLDNGTLEGTGLENFNAHGEIKRLEKLIKDLR